MFQWKNTSGQYPRPSRSAKPSARVWLGLGLTLALTAGACGSDASPSGEADDPVNEVTPKHDASTVVKKKDGGTTTTKPGNTSDTPTGGSTPMGSAGGSDAGAKAPTPTAGGADSWCKAKAVFDSKCVSCHDGKGTAGAPMGLTSFADLTAAAVETKGKKVYQTVGDRVHSTSNPMPPKGTLTDAELAALDAFVATNPTGSSAPTCGSTATTPGADAGTAPADADWPPAECDMVYKVLSHGSGGMNTPYPVPAGQEIHPTVSVDAPWGNEDVQAIAFHPITDNKKVLHHWILYSGQGAFLVGWAPGDDVRKPYPDDVGMDMPKGAGSLRMDMHYFNTTGTKTENDNSGLEICIVKGDHMRPKHAAVTMGFTSFGPVLAPAGAVNAPSTGTCKVQGSNIHLLTAAPHAHKLAVHMKFTLTRASGETIVMHDKDFHFGEQGTYALEPEIVINTGDTVTTTCYYTNPGNTSVTFGESTTNEMCFNFAAYYPAGGLSCGLF